MSHTTKLILRVVMNRVRGITLRKKARDQHGYMPDKGTRNAIFLLGRMSARAIEKLKDIYAGFIDYSKAFDTEEYQARCMSEMCSVSSFVRNVDWNDNEKYWIQGMLQNRWQSDQQS